MTFEAGIVTVVDAALKLATCVLEGFALQLVNDWPEGTVALIATTVPAA